MIHAVGPVWKDGHSKETEQLRDCVRNSLGKFEGKVIKSISLPAISSGIFGFPKELCAEIMIKTAILMIEKGETEVEDIRFTNFDMPTVDVFQKKFEEILKKYDQEQGKFNFSNGVKDHAPRKFLFYFCFKKQIFEGEEPLIEENEPENKVIDTIHSEKTKFRLVSGKIKAETSDSNLLFYKATDSHKNE